MNISLAVLFKLRMAAILKEVGRRKTAFSHLHSLKGAVWPRGKPIPSMPSAHWYLQATSVETLGRYSTGFISSPLEKRRPRPPRLHLLNETQGQPFSKKYKSNSCTTFQSQCLVESWYPVQNEVAAISLMRGALLNYLYDTSLIPEVYNWSSASEGMAG